MRRLIAGLALCLLVAACAAPTESTEPLVDPSPYLVRPGAVHVGDAPVTDRTRHLVAVAQTLYTFWNTGDASYLDRAVDDTFVDSTLPAGRPQGPEGPISASTSFRAAVPDLTCELADLYITGDAFTARLTFRGHFSGSYDGVPGAGQPVEFGAIDIQRVGDTRIVEDWHLEDNLTFMQQTGLVAS